VNKLATIGAHIQRNTKENSPLILSAIAGIGTIATAYLAARASFKAADVIMKAEQEDGYPIDQKLRRKIRVKLVWKLYIPTAVSAAGTVGCIVGANRVSVSKTLAAQSALAISQQAFTNYRDKVVEELGEHKATTIRDKVAEDKVLENPPSPLLVSGPGNVLCCELFTGRYFTSDMESLRKAQNDVNSKALKHDYATLDDLYHILGLGRTTSSNDLGWGSEKMLDLEFTTIMTADGRPCLAFDYNYVKPL